MAFLFFFYITLQFSSELQTKLGYYKRIIFHRISQEPKQELIHTHVPFLTARIPAWLHMAGCRIQPLRLTQLLQALTLTETFHSLVGFVFLEHV